MLDQTRDVRSIVGAMKGSSSFHILIRNWKTLSMNLGVNQVFIDDLERKRNIGTIQANEIPYEILRFWIADQGSKATFRALHDALVESELHDVAGSLLAKFWKPEFMRSIKFEWQGKVVTLEELLGQDIPNESYQKIFDTFRKQSTTICRLQEGPIQLLKEKLTPPSQPKYYVPRTLLIPLPELNSKFFLSDSTKGNIFIFKGISKPDLASLTGYQPIDRSSNQLHNVTVKFILLECDDDFDRICKSTTKPVHLIRHENGRNFWLKSTQGLDLIRESLKHEGKLVSEQELATKVRSLSPSCALSIADSPGMGKTLVLADLAEKIQAEQRKNIVLFIVLQEFVQQLGEVKSKTSALDAIAAYSSRDQMTKSILFELFNKNDYHLSLFLDGYDEVMQEKLNEVDSFLKHLQEHKNVKVIVTSRPHLRTRLEIILNELSIQILPFNASNQIDFLTKYWTDQHEAKEGPRLTGFAKKCLLVLGTKLTDKEKAIAGIPLQCMMLAEVYAEDAKRASTQETLNLDAVKPISFFQMYEKLIELKFTRIEDPSKKASYVDAHVHEAVKLLFPEWTEIFKPLLNGDTEINDESVLYSIGLMEKSPHKNAPRFIHRTFAEYVLADFIVKNLEKHKECLDLLFGEILGRKGTMEKNSNEYYADYIARDCYKLKYPTIGYFIELHIKKYAMNNELSSKFVRFLGKARFNCEDICVTMKVCSTNDLEYTFDYAANVLQNYSILPQKRDKYFKDLPHLVVYYSNNITMLEKVLQFTNSKFGADLTFHTFQHWRSPTGFKFSKCTPLQIAIERGKYNMVSFLIQKLGDEAKKVESLLRLCIIRSSSEKKSVLNDKILIIDLLVKLNSEWIKDKELLLEESIASSLLQRLVEHGAYINSYCSRKGTVLHMTTKKDTYTELVRCVFSNGFKLVNQTDGFKRTPLMHAIWNFGTLEDEALDLFHKAGADFNAKDGEGRSVLFCALMTSNNVDFIRKIIEYGADVNYTNEKNVNVAHLVIINFGNNPKHVLSVLKLLDSKGFSLFNEKNSNGSSPLDMARAKAKIYEGYEELCAFLLIKFARAKANAIT